MPAQTYSLAQFVSEINSLGTGTVYPYASLSGHSSSSCKLVSVDSGTGGIQFVRNGRAQIEKISGANVSKLVEALATCKAVEMNALFGGSGNARSALEAFVAHTPHVYLCKINGKKHIYYSSEKQHPSGQIEIDTNPSVPVYSGIDTERRTDDLGLVVGMQSEESPYGVVTIIDDDDYSYQVLCVNDAKHSKGIRTISKILVKEWIGAVTSDPTKNASTIRDDLCGKSDVDKFEYGNEGVLIKLAKMATGQAPHSIIDVSEYWNRRLGRSEKAILPPADLLSVALKLFDKEREGSDKHNKYADLARAWFADYTPQKLKDNFTTFRDDLIWSDRVQMKVTKDYAHVDKLADLLDELKREPRPLAYYLGNDFKAKMDECPGIGIGTIVDMLMKMHPDEYCAYTDMMHSSLKMLGLLPANASTKLNSENYRRAMGLYEEIRQRMIQMGIHLTRGENTDDPDFLTVNSFLWFVKENIDLIKEKVMSKAMKKDKPHKYKGEKKLEWNENSKDDELLLRLLASLRAKPFAILAGHSGTGKSRYVKKLAYMTCNAEELRNEKQLPGNYLLLQVKPNWHDSTDLLGYRNAITEGKYQPTELIKFIFRAYQFSETPFFLCLDEMNLAPVEQYFAEFLSAMESKEPVPLNDISEKEGNLFELGCEWEDSLKYLKENGFSIPKNLFIVGTVNMDETTNQFSRKVLDRAFTIEMTDVDFANYGNVTEPSYADTIEEETIEQLLAGEKLVKELDEEDKKEDSSLIKVQKALAATPFAIAYRFANEYTLLKRAIETFDPQGTMTLDALDQAVLMKILPRIAGERDYIEKVYGDKETVGLRSALVGKTVSLDKINEILERAKNTNANYITFWP